MANSNLSCPGPRTRCVRPRLRSGVDKKPDRHSASFPGGSTNSAGPAVAWWLTERGGERGGLLIHWSAGKSSRQGRMGRGTTRGLSLTLTSGEASFSDFVRAAGVLLAGRMSCRNDERQARCPSFGHLHKLSVGAGERSAEMCRLPGINLTWTSPCAPFLLSQLNPTTH